MKRGIYATEYGNAAYVAGPHATRAWDIDMGEWIPMDFVTEEFIRCAEDEDEPTEE